MPINRDVDAKKAARQRREARYYTADRVGPPCLDHACHLKLDARLAALGETTHPTCSTEARQLLKADRLLQKTAVRREDITGERRVTDDPGTRQSPEPERVTRQ